MSFELEKTSFDEIFVTCKKTHRYLVPDGINYWGSFNTRKDFFKSKKAAKRAIKEYKKKEREQ